MSKMRRTEDFIVVTELTKKCEYPGCENEATHFAVNNYPRHIHKNMFFTEVKCYCEDHAYYVAECANTEYTNSCPNCGCVFGTGN